MHISILAPSHKSFISDFLPNYLERDLPEGYSGAPFIGTLIAELLILNHTVTAITTTTAVGDDYSIKQYVNGNFTWIIIPARPRSFAFNGFKLGRIVDFYSLEQKNIIELLNNIKPDIVHAYWSYEFAGAAIKSGLPCLVTIQDNAFQVLKYFKNLYRFFRLIMSELYLRKITYASVPSPYMFEYAKNRCSVVNIIPNFVQFFLSESDVKFLVDSKIQSLSSPKLIMIFNGWDERKNGKTALNAFKLLSTKIPKAQLFLFGAGTEMNGYAFNDAKQMNIENVIFNGSVSHNDIIDAIKDSHILLHSSLEESFGVVLIEAMSLGVPAIGGRNSGAVPWVIKNDNLCVDVRDPEEMANKMFDLLTDEDFYQKSSLSVFLNVVNRFSSKTVVKKYLDYYEEILQKNLC